MQEKERKHKMSDSSRKRVKGGWRGRESGSEDRKEGCKDGGRCAERTNDDEKQK